MGVLTRIRLAAAVLVVSCAAGVGVTGIASGQDVAPTDPAATASSACAKVYTTKEVLPLAKRAWSRAYGPTKAQIHEYHGMLACPKPGSRGFLKGTWRKAQHKYAHLRQMKRWRKACGDSNVLPCIHYAADTYNQDYGHAEAVAYRESTLNPDVCNSSDHCGLFQFDYGTWISCDIEGRSADRGNPFWNAMCAMWYWARGEQSRWAETY